MEHTTNIGGGRMAKKAKAGTVVRYGMTGRGMRVKTGGAQWNDAAEAEFFDQLAASANVRLSAEAVGFTTFTVYRQRRMRPDFAAKWKVAVAQGYARLELALLQAAIDSIEDVTFDGERPIPKMTVEQAMNVLRAHRHELAGEGRRGPGNPARRRTLDEVRASILKKVRAIRAAEDGAGEHSPSALREGLGEGGSSTEDAACGYALAQPLPRAGGEFLGASGEGFLDFARNEREGAGGDGELSGVGLASEQALPRPIPQVGGESKGGEFEA